MKPQNIIIFTLFILCLVLVVTYSLILLLSLDLVLYNIYFEMIARLMLFIVFMSYIKAIVRKVKRKLHLKFKYSNFN